MGSFSSYNHELTLEQQMVVLGPFINQVIECIHSQTMT